MLIGSTQVPEGHCPLVTMWELFGTRQILNQYAGFHTYAPRREGVVE